MPELPNEKLYTPHTRIDPPDRVAACEYAYAELDVITNYSFLRGASHPDELVYTAALLGYRAMAITDINSLAGVVRAYEAAKKVAGFKLIVGARLAFKDGSPDVLVWPADRAAYGRLCGLLTFGKRRATKGECHLTLPDFIERCEGMQAAIVMPACVDPAEPFPRGLEDAVLALAGAMGDRLSLAVSLCHDGDDAARIERIDLFARDVGVPMLATNHVHYHDPGRRPLQDVVTCIRHGCTLDQAGYRLFQNHERYLKSPEQMRWLFYDYPAAVHRALQVAKRCTFSLGELQYVYPDDFTPAGMNASDHLRALTWAGAKRRYPGGIPMKVKRLLVKELKLICGSKYEPYFLTVYDIVLEARRRKILCQGRGSAANSAVCFCLGVTSVDPMKFQLVFARFISASRNEPPDIDIDFEHERREEVIQYVYEKYGRDRAGMTASLITYRGRSAIRDVGKAMGLTSDVLEEMAGKLDWWHKGTLSESQLSETGLDSADATIQKLLWLTTELLGFPRHLSQHVGGMVISRTPLGDLVPIENASMEERTVIEWDKDDLDTMQMFKIDILALGMLTCLSKAMSYVDSKRPLEIALLPWADPATYEMIQDADTVGVFQIESRAQMSMLPRLKPREFYDLVVEVAIVRPGPIQGDMVHPYLQRREALLADPNFRIEYPKPELEQVLKGTLGIPLFQEQAMSMSIVAAGFTEAEADELRRGMAAWKRSEGLGRFHDKFVQGMIDNGYEPDFAERCFEQIKGFGSYGFPESHAVSFALLVYASAWLKRHHPAAFCAGLLNSYPMGFYAPAQLVRDAREHGVEVRSVDVNASEWDCTLEHDQPSRQGLPAREDLTRTNMAETAMPPSGKHTWGLDGPALRLGFRQIKSMKLADAQKIVAERIARGPFDSVESFHRRTGLTGPTVRRLAEADAFSSIELSRRQSGWHALAIGAEATPIIDVTACADEAIPPLLPTMSEPLEVLTDYNTTGLSLKRHPVEFIRRQLGRERIITAAELKDAKRFPQDTWVKVAGLVLVRQRPGTASGVVFISLEDETGTANLILWSHVYERYRPAARHATLLQCDGCVQREGKVIHVLAKRLYDRSDLIAGLTQTSRDFH